MKSARLLLHGLVRSSEGQDQPATGEPTARVPRALPRPLIARNRDGRLEGREYSEEERGGREDVCSVVRYGSY